MDCFKPIELKRGFSSDEHDPLAPPAGLEVVFQQDRGTFRCTEMSPVQHKNSLTSELSSKEEIPSVRDSP